MKKREEKAYLDKHWKKMQQHFESFIHGQDQEELHQFRVQVKKIRSFLTLLEERKKNDHLQKTFKPVKKVFKCAGVIRDAYLHQQQAREHHISSARFYKEQDAIQQAATHDLLDEGRRHLRRMKKAKQNLRKQLHAVSADNIKAFYQSQLDSTRSLLQQHGFTEQLHDGRKMLKHLMYNQHTVQNGIAEDLHLNFSYIDDLQNVLGQWHDNKLALEFFRQRINAAALNALKAKNQEWEEIISEKARDFEAKVNAKLFDGPVAAT
jgi:CHAD domain-containing protein